MLRCLRLLISAVILTTALAGGGAFAAKMNHVCLEMSMDDCPGHGGDDGAALPMCAEILCGPSQAALPQFQPLLDALFWGYAPPLTPCDDIEFSGLRSPPALRPPIV